MNCFTVLSLSGGNLSFIVSVGSSLNAVDCSLQRDLYDFKGELDGNCCCFIKISDGRYFCLHLQIM